MAIEHLRFHSTHDPLPEVDDLADKLRAQIIEVHFVKILQFGLLDQWSHQGEALSFLEKGCQHFSNLILLLSILAVSFLQRECFLQILFGCHLVTFTVLNLKGEVPNHPEKGGEIVSNFLRVIIIS